MEPYRSAHHLGEAMGPVALGVAATFAAYLIGTFFNETRGVLARLYLRARQSASAASAVEREAVVDQARQKRWERRREQRRELLARMSEGVPKRRRTGKPETKPQRALLALVEQASKALVEVLLVPRQIAGAAGALTLGLTENTYALVDALQENVYAVVRRVSSIRIEPYRPFLSQRGVDTIERYLKEQRASKAHARDLTVADVIGDFPIIRTRLIQQSPDTVSEYDRLRAEADFRSAIFFPLVAVVAIFVIKVSWIWGLAVLPLLVLLGTARVKRGEAGDVLADLLGVIEAPCTESAEASPPHQSLPVRRPPR